jgi:AcrR family transcriptional regulator
MVDREPDTIIWDRLDPAGRGPRPLLSHQQIVEQAMTLADDEGLEAVSMRRVSAALGVGTMSLYRYVKSRDEIIDLMVDAVIGEQLDQAESSEGDWRSAVHQMARSMRTVAHRHPWVIWLLLGRLRLGPNALRLIEQTLKGIDTLGLDIDTMLDLTSIVTSFTVGFVQAELAEEEALRRTGLSDHEWRDLLTPYMLRILSTGKYPMLDKIVRDAEDFPDNDKLFERRLNMVLDGIEHQLKHTKPGKKKRAKPHP